MRRRQASARFLALAMAPACLIPIACGPPRDPSIVYKKLTPEEFAGLPPEEQSLPEVREMMGDQWKDPFKAENAPNPRRKRR